LATPKDDYEPTNIFKYKDFRGLLHADYEEAINNSNISKKMNFSK
jgi:hypothetical protein